MEKISLLGININPVTKKEIISAISGLSGTGLRRTAFYVNAHCVNTAFSDSSYRFILNSGDLVYAGGQGVVWASRFRGRPLPERVNILDFLDDLIDELRGAGTKIYLLGSEDNIAEKAKDALRKKGLNVVGARNGFFEDREEDDTIREINSLKPDILMVGMGVPKQEKWINKNLERLDVRLCWAVGAAFEWIAGYRKRAPLWMVGSGLEWLHRLGQQPGRFSRRYLLGNLIFIYRVFFNRYAGGRTARKSLLFY